MFNVWSLFVGSPWRVLLLLLLLSFIFIEIILSLVLVKTLLLSPFERLLLRGLIPLSLLIIIWHLRGLVPLSLLVLIWLRFWWPIRFWLFLLLVLIVTLHWLQVSLSKVLSSVSLVTIWLRSPLYIRLFLRSCSIRRLSLSSWVLWVLILWVVSSTKIKLTMILIGFLKVFIVWFSLHLCLKVRVSILMLLILRRFIMG